MVINIVLLGALGAALIAGGIFFYRGITKTNVRALGAAAVAAGVVIWAIILFITPVFSSTG